MWSLQNVYLILWFYWGTQIYSMKFNNGDNLISTSKCTIPSLSVFPPNEYNYFVKYAPIQCSTFYPLLSYTRVVYGVPWLYIRTEVAEKYFGSLESTKCCYKYVFRNGSEEQPDRGIRFSDCFKLEKKVELKYDTVWVSCNMTETNQSKTSVSPQNENQTENYENVHQIVRLKANIRRKTETLKHKSNKKTISVLMIVIDSVSRLNFMRTMPKTRNFIMENEFYELKAYNKVGDNSFPNVMAFLTGMNVNDSDRICKAETVDGLTNCPFIWYKYRDYGYATAFVEDWANIATFNHHKKGFRVNPTDYYFRPYMEAVSMLKTTYQDRMPFCAGPESQGQRILNLAYDFATTFNKLPSFGIFWMNTFSHNAINTPVTMDEKVEEFFEKLKHSEVLKENIVILLSDHGMRDQYTLFSCRARSFYEQRLPMHYISLPPWFKKSYPVETANLIGNSEKLTSNYDLYMTFQHILELSGINYSSTPSLACPKCKSLFKYIENERSCLDAGR